MDKKRFVNILLLLVLSLIWGSSYILMKKGLVAFSNIQVAALRLSLCFLFFTPILYKSVRATKARHWKWLLITGFIGTALPAFLYATCITKVSSSVTGIINSLTPLFTLLIGILLFGVKSNWLKLAGVACGLAGASLLVLFKPDGQFTAEIGFALLAVLATVSYGLSVNVLKSKLADLPSVHITALGFGLVGIPCMIILLSTDFLSLYRSHEAFNSSFLAVLALSFFGSALALLLFNYLLKRSSALFASTVTYLMPLVAISWGLMDGETIGLYHLVGMSFILAGVWLVTKAGSAKISNPK